MDGTLIDTMPAHLAAWQATADRFDFPFCQEWLHSLGGMPSFKIVAELNRHYGLSLDPQTVSKFKMETFAAMELQGEVIQCTGIVLDEYLGQKENCGRNGKSARKCDASAQSCRVDRQA